MADTAFCIAYPQACSTIDAIYWWFLGHAADAPGQDYWLNLLLDVTGFAGDPKAAAAAIALNYSANAPRATASSFHGNFWQNLGFGWNQDVAWQVVANRYQRVLGRPPDNTTPPGGGQTGHQFWCSWLVNGWHSIDELDCQMWMAAHGVSSCGAPAPAPAPAPPAPAPAPPAPTTSPPAPVSPAPTTTPSTPAPAVPVQQPNLPPATASQIDSWYELYLCRPADSAGLAYWLAQPDAAHTQAAIAASTEAQAVIARGGCGAVPSTTPSGGGSNTPLIIAGVGVAAVVGIVLATKPAAPVRPNATRVTAAA